MLKTSYISASIGAIYNKIYTIEFTSSLIEWKYVWWVSDHYERSENES